jgi:hypothetical protein
VLLVREGGIMRQLGLQAWPTARASQPRHLRFSALVRNFCDTGASAAPFVYLRWAYGRAAGAEERFRRPSGPLHDVVQSPLRTIGGEAQQHRHHDPNYDLNREAFAVCSLLMALPFLLSSPVPGGSLHTLGPERRGLAFRPDPAAHHLAASYPM